jgi:hypothetical protein
MNVSIPFRPKLAEVSMGCSPGDFQAGSVADITVGIVALPLVMERVNCVLNLPATSFAAANKSRWLPEPDKTDTVGGVKRSSPDHPNPIPKSRVPAVGAPASGTARKEIPRDHAVLPPSPGFGAPGEAGAPGAKEIPREHAVPEAGAPGIAEPVGR